MERLKVALIGAGQIARTSHIPNYREMEDVEIVGICDANREAAGDLARQFAIPAYYDSHKEMLLECKPDAVSICVPNKYHCGITLDALDAGCHVMCEKPPAITAGEAYEMMEMARKKQRLLSYGFHLRHSSQVAMIKDKILQGQFGKLYAVRASWLRRRGIPGWGCFTNKEIQGGGPLIDIGAHVLDIAVYLLGYPKIDYVCASFHNLIGTQGGTGLMGAWDGQRFTVEDSLFGYIQFSGNICLQLDTAFALHMKEKDIRNVSIYGSQMGADVLSSRLYKQDGDRPVDISYPMEETEDLHQKELRNFVRACQGLEPLLVTGEEGYYVQRILESLYQSAETGKPVELS